LSLIVDAVKKFEDTICGSGCEHNNVVLKKVDGNTVCQYAEGVNLEVTYGGKRSYLVTNYPIEAVTRMSFMFGKSLDTPRHRSAACGIINSVLGFLCLVRKTNPCKPESHGDCLSSLMCELEGKNIFCTGNTLAATVSGCNIVDDPDDADIILISGEGVFSGSDLSIVDQYLNTKRMIFLGPGTSGICYLMGLEHWCPYGRSK